MDKQNGQDTPGRQSERRGSALRIWWKQLKCAASGHGGMRQIVCYIWECKKCGKRINMH